MNGFVTDVDYFRKNRNIFKFSTFLIFALIVPSVVYSQPDNEIELPPSNVDFENGLVRKYQLHNGFYKDSFTGNFKHYPIRKGKHHKKSIKLKSRKFLDPNKQYFDYYPVEKVDLKYDSKEDDNIDVILLSDQEKLKNNLTKLLDNKIHNNKHNILNKKRTKRDLNDNKNDEKIKRQIGYNYQVPPINPTFDREYYSQGTQNDPWNNEFNSRILASLAKPQIKLIKYSIPGNYYNAISPSGYYLPAVNRPDGSSNEPTISIGNRGDYDDERLVWGRIPIPVRGNNNRPVNEGRDDCNCDEPIRGTGNQNRNPSTQQNKNPSPPLIHVARPSGSRSPNTPTGFGTRFDSDINDRDRVVWDRSPGRVNFDESHAPPPLIHQAQDSASNRIGNTNSISSDNGFSGAPPSEFQAKEPSKCVWAIVSCCARNNARVRYACFEEVGCLGAFWDINPCADEYQRKAIAEADSFFE